MSQPDADSDHLIVVIDESSPNDGAGGVAYVVVAAALMVPVGLAAKLRETIGVDRVRPFHWTKEGKVARRAIIDLAIEEGVIALAFCKHIGRRGQVAARQRIISELSTWAAAEGATHVIIESGDAATDGRDKATLLDTHRAAGGVPFLYDWRSKNEPLLWIADAIAGAVGEHVSGKDSSWFQRLDQAKVLDLRYH